MRGARAGRPEAAAAIWSWRERASEPAPDPAAGARRRGSLQALAGAAAGAAALALGSRALAQAIFAFAALVLVAALASPGGLYAGLLLRRGRRDRLARRFEPGAASYWEPRDSRAPTRASARLDRQY